MASTSITENVLRFTRDGDPADRLTGYVSDWFEYGDVFIQPEGGPDPEWQARHWKLDRNKQYLLIRTCNDGNYAQLSSHDTPDDAATFHSNDRQDWYVVALVDLHTDTEYTAIHTTTWTPATK